VGARALLANSLIALAILAVPATASARGCTGGTLYVDKGFDNLRLGDSRDNVVSELGAPYFENGNGFMQYAPDDAVPECDIYRVSGAKHSTVRMFAFSGRRFVVSGGIHIFDNGGLRKLKARYPRMKIVTDPEDGEKFYEIRGHYHGRKVFTSITPSKLSLSGRALQVFIGFV
jgi:hypothetical protein